MTYAGPLAGVRVLELGGVGPVPFAGMLLADMGADVVRIARPDAPAVPGPVSLRGHTVVPIVLTEPAGRELARGLAAQADIVLDGFRPGVADRLGIGPAELTAARPGLVYGRASGWGSTGPLADSPGHDINYLGLSGALSLCRDATGTPVPPPGLAGDFGGGGAMLVAGVLAALHEARGTGRGQLVESSILAGSAILTAPLWGGRRGDPRAVAIAAGILRGAAPFYRVYRCADDRFVAVGAYEPAFFAAFVDHVGLTGPAWADQFAIDQWAAASTDAARTFATRTRADWCIPHAAAAACITPVLDLDEAAEHEHNVAVGLFRASADGLEPAPTPRFGRGAVSTREPTAVLDDPAAVRRRWADLGSAQRR